MPPPPAAGPNRLAEEKSPYLRQHRFNPVDWQAWGEAAFARARAEQKPIFLSLGYSTCHWCHVMAHESFENPAIAALLNAHFVSVKVDREERPDVDRLYMTYVQATTGQGGWPLSVWLTPDLQPFFGGTYFPPEDRSGRLGFATVLQRLAEAWQQDRAAILRLAGRALDSLRERAMRTAGGDGGISREALTGGWNALREHFDTEWGGFGGGPKFPQPVTLNFLFRIAVRRDGTGAGESGSPERDAQRMAEETLQRIAQGGIHDHLGGGFHRYAVDRRWLVPHFEKMLYDQAQLAVGFLEAWQATHRAPFAWVARGIFACVERDFTAPGGGFFSAEDADSPRPDDPAQRGEGAFYLWTWNEIETICGPDAPLARLHYGLSPEGNARDDADPHGEFRGRNILHQAQPLARTAQTLGLDLPEAERRLLAANAKLLAARSQRPRPQRDDKILTAWNGLMISSLARASQVLLDDGTGGDETGANEGKGPGATAIADAVECLPYLRRAERAAQFLQTELYDSTANQLYRCWCDGRSDIAGLAGDFAFLIAGLLDLYEAGGAIRWLRWAIELQAAMDNRFWDDDGGGYFDGPAGDPTMPIRLKEDHDGAEPSPNSIAALNLLRLAAMLDRRDWRRRAEQTIAAFRRQWTEAPHALPQMLVAIDFALGPVRQIVLAGRPDEAEMRELRRVIHGKLEAPRVILWADAGEGQAWLAERVPFYREVHALDGKPAAYVCREFTCQLPTSDPAQLAQLLA